MSNWVLALAVCLSVAGIVRGQGPVQAVGTGLTSAPLFSITWNLTGNYVQYDARLRDGELDPKEPVVAYWIMKQTDSHHEPLRLMERLKGYGFSIHPGSALSFRYCQAIGTVLHSDPNSGYYSRRAGEEMATVCEQFNWLSEDCTTVVIDRSENRTSWWTFAGVRANAMLAHAFRERFGICGSVAKRGQADLVG